DKSSASVSVGNNQTYIIDGQRGFVSVNQGGILKGTGTVGDLDVNTGGTVAPGHSPGCLSTGNLALNGTYQAEIGGTTACTGYDQMKVTGTVNLTGSTLVASLYNNYVPKVGESYTIIDNDGTDAVTGTFANLAEGATFKIGSNVLKVTYKGGTGNDVVLSVVSTPASPNTGFGGISARPGATFLASVLAGGAILGIARRTRKVSVRG
ncbi:MAG TPA: hypothetical protein VFP32_02085, partial [Candidatus Saccharimonadales bacterium]|nr:hypothetical protein [Candidatus Saccharimonadales bacterium]